MGKNEKGCDSFTLKIASNFETASGGFELVQIRNLGKFTNIEGLIGLGFKSVMSRHITVANIYYIEHSAIK